MKKHLIVIGTAVLLLVVGLSGCVGKENNGIEILNYEMNEKSFGVIGEGIEVTGTAKNNADYLQRVTIVGKLYDANNNYLGNSLSHTALYYIQENVDKYSVPAGYTWDFTVIFVGDFVSNAKTVKFDISTS